MRKFFYALAALALVGVSSCSSDDDYLLSEGEGDFSVTFVAGAENATQSRSVTSANGKTATNLTVVAYNAGTKTVAATASTTMSDLKCSVTLKFVKGRSYDVVFWADAPESPYTFDKTNQRIDISYDGAVTNDENRDAFYATRTIAVCDTTSTQSVTLKRPFSRVSIATSYDDWKTALYAKGLPLYTQVEVPVYSQFDPISGQGIGEPTVQTFAANDYLNDSGSAGIIVVNSVYYVNICTNYLLTKPSGDIVDITLSYGDAHTTVDAETDETTSEFVPVGTKTFTNVPVRGNYWTKIIGDLFSKSVDYNVEIKPALDGSVVYEGETSPFESAVEQAIFTGGEATLEEDLTVTNGLSFNADVPTEIDLNGKTLTLDYDYSMIVPAGADVTFKNGNLVCESQSGSVANFCLSAGSTLTLDGCTIESSGSVIYPIGAAEVNISDSDITGGSYALATNASSESNWNSVINISNSTFRGVTPVCINVPCTVTLTDCHLYGKAQGLSVRGGTVIVKGGDITLTDDLFTDDATAANYYNSYRTTEWGQGTYIPYAGITLGNRHSTSYQYPSSLTLDGVTVNGCNYSSDIYFPAIYVYANDAVNNVTFDYTGCTFNGPVQYGSANIIVNGTETAPTE